MDTDASAADLTAIEHDVIGLRPDFAKIGLEESGVFIHGCGEWMVFGHETILFLAVFKLREFCNP